MTKTVTAIQQTRCFAGSPHEVRNVRAFVWEMIPGCPVGDDVVLLASELATNAVTHTASGEHGTFDVGICLEEARVRVEVHDGGSVKTPAARRASATEESGVGLGLVEMIAARWGHDGGPSGRVVWFEMEWQ